MTDLVIVPRWSGTDASDYYPWLATQAQTLGLAPRFVPLLPVPSAPEPASTIAAVVGAIRDPRTTILLGHSVGSRAALAAARQLAAPLRALVLVAGWFEVDRPWASIVPWLATDREAPPAADRFEVLISDDDPFTADHATTRARFEALGARVTLVHGAKHFNAAHEASVLELLRVVAA